MTAPAPHLSFHALPNIFTDFSAECAADPKLKIATQPSLALIDRTYPSDDPRTSDESAKPWERLAAYVSSLNKNAKKGTSYKVLYLSRHGIGFHNAMHAKVGTEEWDNHWSRLEGDGTVTWLDAHLIPQGIQQAKDLSTFYESASETLGLTIPSILYTSPLARCLETTRLIFEPIYTQRNLPFRPRIREGLRERMTDHTCDKRSSRTWIAENYPNYEIEPGFPETDILWDPLRWEPVAEHLARKHKVLEEVFADAGSEEFVSLTVHSYAIAALLRVCNAKVYRVREGSSLALLVEATEVDAAPSFTNDDIGIANL